MKGWRTIAVGLAFAVAPAALTYLGNIDWSSVVGPNVAMFIAGAITVGMRLITNTPPGQAS